LSLRDRILKALPFSGGELDMLIWSAPHRYKHFEIAKRQHGAYRKISQPTPEVKLLQRWLVNNYLNQFPVHRSATAYRRRIGLAANVLPHSKNRFLFKIDFSDFFPSIKSSHFVEFMRLHKQTSEDIDVARHICFKHDRKKGELQLAIGAPSSPLLSNVMMYRLDTELANMAEANQVVYTRYADDLSFSCANPNILQLIEKELVDIIYHNSIVPLVINSNKTVHSSKKNGRVITGIVITPEGNLSVGRERKRLLRAQIHRFKCGNLPPEEIAAVSGYVAFLHSVEPTHLHRLVTNFGAETMRILFPALDI